MKTIESRMWVPVGAHPDMSDKDKDELAEKVNQLTQHIHEVINDRGLGEGIDPLNLAVILTAVATSLLKGFEVSDSVVRELVHKIVEGNISVATKDIEPFVGGTKGDKMRSAVVKPGHEAWDELNGEFIKESSENELDALLKNMKINKDRPN